MNEKEIYEQIYQILTDEGELTEDRANELRRLYKVDAIIDFEPETKSPVTVSNESSDALWGSW